ncbi:MAG: FAD/NAD(P)-binding protein [Bacteroidota bacterium]
MKHIGIIGGGFSGTMTAVQLIYKATNPIKISIINDRDNFNKGFAYSPYSKKHILNVITEKMSAFPDKAHDFLDWVMLQEEFKSYDRTLIANSFLPRYVYGQYLVDTWEKAKMIASEKNIELQIIESVVDDIDVSEEKITIELNTAEKITVDQCVITSGNQVPRNPAIPNMDFYKSSNYFQNPWLIDSVLHLDSELPVLVIGNGLTMVDTVFGLLEHGFKNKIYSISPNGFNILPHRHNGLKYTKLVEEFTENMSLYDFVKLVNKHVKLVREYGVTAEPVIDSIRPYTQSIWKKLNDTERTKFMSRLRHLWGVARHRFPMHSHDKIQQLRIDNKLLIKSGKILNFTEVSPKHIVVEYYDKKEKEVKTFEVSRVINCTGPESNLSLVEKSFLKNALMKGILKQDSLYLGIVTDTDTFQIIDTNNNKHHHLFTIGTNLKGELWESTAVNELRAQADKLAQLLIA